MYQTVIMAFDGTLEGRRALSEGADFVSKLGATVHLLAVLRPPSGIALAEGVYPLDALKEDQARLKAIVQEGVDLLKAQGVHPQGHIAFGDPVRQIARLAELENADLVVVGHRRRGPLARWWQGSVGMSLLDQLHCSLLIAMKKQKDDQTPEPT